ncbi:MAG: 50S ribosomal protein L15e [Nanoarchaeota archaeon]|nr:50S ribosomal protein L15e [Nanoarchaeota archaeon]
MAEKKEAKKTKAKTEKKAPSKSAKGLYHKIREAWKKPEKKTLRERMIEWRASGSFTKVSKPLRLDRARALGYKAKKGFIIVRVKIGRGGHKRKRPNKGRRSKRLHVRKNLKMSYKWIAEQRVEKKYKNLVVLNSYLIGKDGQHYFYEVICVDPERPEIKKDKNLSWTTKPQNKKRTMHGLTSAAKKSRGLRNKHPTSKVRPSVRAGKRRGK